MGKSTADRNRNQRALPNVWLFWICNAISGSGLMRTVANGEAFSPAADKLWKYSLTIKPQRGVFTWPFNAQ